jgi:hypothetical protein
MNLCQRAPQAGGERSGRGCLEATDSKQNVALNQRCRSVKYYNPLGVDDMLDSTVTDSKRACDLSHTLAFGPQRDHLSLYIGTYARPTQDFAPCLCSLQTSLDALHDLAYLKLCQDSEHLEE